MPKQPKESYFKGEENLDRVPRLRPLKQRVKRSVDAAIQKDQKNQYYFRTRALGKKKPKPVKEVRAIPRRHRRTHTELSKAKRQRLRQIDGEYILLNDDESKPEHERVKIRVWKGLIKKTYQNALVSSTRALLRQTGGVKKRTKTKHLGTWCCYQDFFYYTGDSRKLKQAARFLANKRNRTVFHKVNELVRKNFPSLYKRMANMNIPPDMRLVGRAFPTIAVNGGSAKGHYDWNDSVDGLSVVIPYGNFKGGQLVFRDLNLSINCEPGDVVAFSSADLYHENLPVLSGERYSMVMFTHETCMNK